MGNNFRISIWADVEQQVLRRIEENKNKLRTVKPEMLPVLQRIQADDEQRLKIAREFLSYHRG